MTSPSAFEAAAFTALLESLYEQWGKFLSRSQPSLRNAHDDLMQQSAEDLSRYAKERTWEDVEDWEKLGFRILHRRIADHFRQGVRRWANEPLSDDLPTRDVSTDPVRVAHYSNQLKRLVSVLAEMEDTDRHLLLAEILDDGPTDRKPMSVAQRKRISRLRARLRDKLEEPEDGG